MLTIGRRVISSHINRKTRRCPERTVRRRRVSLQKRDCGVESVRLVASTALPAPDATIAARPPTLVSERMISRLYILVSTSRPAFIR
ncbi:hypothetical protein KMZ68_10335 [Bradyrhizobium sediminis]|uniref:Uncharacterized protein n=1 Tax=Bradyrhizobium sediminis TaxID=2840469 RepID=A0A975RUT8_9BRAD|nr:hypothetical protein KMZ68_10335 [Bradyrhizobium sediminis]